MRKRPTRDDSGAALILVLIVVTVIAVTLGALLSVSDASIRGTLNLSQQATTSYEADGAMQAAVNNLRNSAVNGQPNQNCFSGGNTLPVSYGSDSAIVSCGIDPSSVRIQCPSLTQCNRPGTAILTTSTIAGEDGINIKDNSGAFNVHGIVFSNSTITVSNGSLNANNAVYARGACTGTITSTPAAQCRYSTANTLGNDPNYQPAITTVPAHQSLPACTRANSIVTFQPGYYDDAVGLSNMMAGNSACRHSTWWFKPGTYYFDFHNGGDIPNPVLTSGSDVWTMNDGYLVAGTPTNSTGAIISTPSNPASIPGACDNPINDPNASGVQFIFGGDSQFFLQAGQAEICGSYSASVPPVGVYGLKTGTATTTTLTGANTLKPNTVVSAGTFTNATPTTLATVDGQYATWLNNSNGNQTGTVTVSGYAPTTTIPLNSILKSAQLRVVHGNTAGATQDNLSVQLTPNGSSATNYPVPSYGDALIHNDTVDVTSQLAPLIYNGTFTGAQAQYSASVKHKGTESLDAIQLDLTYVAPALRAENGCITTGPYLGNGSCALIKTKNSPGNQFYVQGTTYAPNAALDISLNNAAEQVFRFGVIARTLYVTVTGSFAYVGPVIEVPDDSPGFVFSVFLNVYMCPGQSTCAAVGAPMISSRVALVDADPTNPQSGHRQVSILSWSGAR